MTHFEHDEDDYYAYNDRGDTEYDSIGGLILIFMVIMIGVPLALGLIDKYTNWLK